MNRLMWKPNHDDFCVNNVWYDIYDNLLKEEEYELQYSEYSLVSSITTEI